VTFECVGTLGTVVNGTEVMTKGQKRLLKEGDELTFPGISGELSQSHRDILIDFVDEEWGGRIKVLVRLVTNVKLSFLSIRLSRPGRGERESNLE
jgi:hypothetical protein